MSTHVDTALNTVDYAEYTTYEDGSKVRESSAPAIIEALTRALEPAPGMRILEIGTGSGYSGALLAAITGPRGHVTSIDIDPKLVNRARNKHADTHHVNIDVICGNGYHGWETNAPYDRIVAWTCPPQLPREWTDQLAPDGVIVTPLSAVDVTTGSITAKLSVASGQPVVTHVMEGSFVPFHGPEGFDVTMLTLPGTRTVTNGGVTVQLCAQQLSADTTDTLAAGLANAAAVEDVLVDVGEHITTSEARTNLRWWLLAHPDAAEGFADGELFVGVATEAGAAVYELDTGTVRRTGAPELVTTLKDRLAAWTASADQTVNALTIELDETPTGWNAALHA